MVSSNILFFGATGTIGIPIVSAVLKDRESFSRLVVFTSATGDAKKLALLRSWKSQDVEIIEGNIEDEKGVQQAFAGIDTIVSALGRQAISTQISLIDLANRTPGIKRFIPSEFGTDIAHSPSSLTEKPHQAKLAVRAALQETDLDFTFLVTGPYPSADPHMYLSFINSKKGEPEDIGSWDVQGRRAVLLGDGEGRVAFTTVWDVGKFVVRILKRPSKLTNRAALKIHSFVATPKALLDEFELQTGAKWSVSFTSLKELRNLEERLWEENSGFRTSCTLRRIWAEGGTLYDTWDNEALGFRKGDTDLRACGARGHRETKQCGKGETSYGAASLKWFSRPHNSPQIGLVRDW